MMIQSHRRRLRSGGGPRLDIRHSESAGEEVSRDDEEKSKSVFSIVASRGDSRSGGGWLMKLGVTGGGMKEGVEAETSGSLPVPVSGC